MNSLQELASGLQQLSDTYDAVSNYEEGTQQTCPLHDMEVNNCCPFHTIAGRVYRTNHFYVKVFLYTCNLPLTTIPSLDNIPEEGVDVVIRYRPFFLEVNGQELLEYLPNTNNDDEDDNEEKIAGCWGEEDQQEILREILRF